MQSYCDIRKKGEGEAAWLQHGKHTDPRVCEIREKTQKQLQACLATLPLTEVQSTSEKPAFQVPKIKIRPVAFTMY